VIILNTTIEDKNLDRLLEKSYPPGIRRHIDFPDTGIYQEFSRSANNSSSLIAIDFLGNKITYSSLKDKVESAASFLHGLKLHKGEMLAIMLPNLPQYIIFFMASMKLGITVVQMNPLYTSPEIEYELKDSGARTIIVLDTMVSKVAEMQGKLLDNIIEVGVEDYLPAAMAILYKLAKKNKTKKGGFHGIIRYSGREKNNSIEDVDIDPYNDVALLQYTGGTTGIPKAAALTHRNLIANSYQLIEWFPEQFKKNISYLASIPYFHVYGMMTAMLTPLLQGSTLIIVPDPRDIKMTLKLIKKKKPTAFPGIPTMYHSIINRPDIGKYGINNVKLCISGAMHLPLELQEKFEDLTGGTLVEGYGLSECSPVTNISPLLLEWKDRRKPGSIGLPLPETYEKIVDIADGKTELLPGQEGELLIKGPQVMKGYWNRPEENKTALTDGWLHTGDIAKMDEDGYFYIVDRKKDMIIAGGYNIYPAEVEEVLYEHPGISDCAVIGVPDEHRGETVKAYIVLADKTLTEEQIKKYCKEKLAVYKVPKIIEFMDKLPVTSVGKIDKKALRNIGK
jgi:long-chain acyl-CoA synthetase